MIATFSVKQIVWCEVITFLFQLPEVRILAKRNISSDFIVCELN